MLDQGTFSLGIAIVISFVYSSETKETWSATWSLPHETLVSVRASSFP